MPGIIDIFSLLEGGPAALVSAAYVPISFPLELPNQHFKKLSISGKFVIGMSESPYTLESQVQEFAGQQWRAEITFPPMTRVEAAPWITFLLKLNGRKGTFLLGDPLGKTPRGLAVGTPLISGANQSGQILVVDGFTPSATGVLLENDYFQIGERLYTCLQDVNSTDTGQAVIDCWPRLREVPPDNEPLILTNTKGLFRLAGGTDVSIWEADETKYYDIKISAIEAI